MGQYTESPVRTMQAGEALAIHRLVKLGAAARDVVYADAADFDEVFGSTEVAVADNEQGPIRVVNAGGTRKLTASAAIVAHDHVICAADGKVAPDGGTTTEDVVGMALEAASADGSVIEVLLYGAVRVLNLV